MRPERLATAPARAGSRRLAAVLPGVLLLASTVLIVFGTMPAAAATNCGSSNTGWFPYEVRIRVVRLRTGRTVRLNLVNDQVSDHSYATLWWDYRKGDKVWVDRSFDGGVSWSQCGPFNRDWSNTLRNVGNWMRACFWAHDTHESFCTDWYYDKD
ncbi:hypothetical protein F0U60_51500 [Archangium minus]|uniref:Secreted protein n=1 Tax=Archangium minus TaxID=83450 RepID=A0ABY9X8A8_9BACT|nr:hypothetical protein F0U60_51500 [Archangium minus]